MNEFSEILSDSKREREIDDESIKFALLHHKIELLKDALWSAKAAIGSGLNWMEQVDRANLSSATRGVLHVDMGMCKNVINRINNLLVNKKDIAVNKESI